MSASQWHRSWIVRTALAYRGTPYRFGARGSGELNAAGFIRFLFAKRGKSLPSSAAAQFKQGKPVAKNALKPGGLVFFKNTYKHGISHVGIYIGSDKFVHVASSRTELRVKRRAWRRQSRRRRKARRLRRQWRRNKATTARLPTREMPYKSAVRPITPTRYWVGSETL